MTKNLRWLLLVSCALGCADLLGISALEATATDANPDPQTSEGSLLPPCEPEQQRLCGEDGLLGNCANGVEVCTENQTWGSCSISPASEDRCEPGDDANCNGVLNERIGQTRGCDEDGLYGTCAVGTERCEASGWGACSVIPAASDTCTPGSDDDCDGTSNRGCACAPGITRLCGFCMNGEQTCGSTGSWGPCTGDTLKTYYVDEDGDGFGDSNTGASHCDVPAALTLVSGDCCDQDPDAKPGQTQARANANRCGSYDWDCDFKDTPRETRMYSACASEDCCQGWEGAKPPVCGEARDWDCNDASSASAVCPSICLSLNPSRTQACL